MVRHTGKDFIDEECVAVASVLPFQSAGINGTEFDTPESDGFSADYDSALSQEIFDVSVTQVEPVVQLNRTADDVRRKSMSPVGVHGPVVSIAVS